MRRYLVFGCLVAVVSLLAPAAFGQGAEFPAKPIRIINPFPPGGSSDLVARTLGQFLTQIWGQPVLVESRPGAGGTLACGVTANSDADGYTLQLASTANAIAPSLYKSLPFDMNEDFTPIILLGEAPLFLAVHPSVGVSSVKELIAAAQARPGVLNYGSSGNGSLTHIAGELFKQTSSTNIKHVPYRGMAPALIDLVAGRVQMMFVDIAALPRIRSGELKALAVARERRSSTLPELPTIAEAGLPAYKIVQWYAVFGPKGIPSAVVAKLNDGFNRALKDQKTLERLSGFGIEPVGGTAATFGRFLRDDVKHYRDIVNSGGITID